MVVQESLSMHERIAVVVFVFGSAVFNFQSINQLLKRLKTKFTPAEDTNFYWATHPPAIAAHERISMKNFRIVVTTILKLNICVFFSRQRNDFMNIRILKKGQLWC